LGGGEYLLAGEMRRRKRSPVPVASQPCPCAGGAGWQHIPSVSEPAQSPHLKVRFLSESCSNAGEE